MQTNWAAETVGSKMDMPVSSRFECTPSQLWKKQNSAQDVRLTAQACTAHPKESLRHPSSVCVSSGSRLTA
eukprot:6193676-Pleurochrysis_carterae.AAC.1